jgi:hypothetical protein
MNNFIKKAALLVALAALSVASDILLAKLKVVDIDSELRELTA